MPLSTFDPDHYPQLLAAKAARVQDLLAPFGGPDAEIVASPGSGFRMRAEFRVWHDGDDLDYVMFRRGEPATPVPVTYFPIACERIQQLMPKLLASLRDDSELRRKLFQVEFLSTLAATLSPSGCTSTAATTTIASTNRPSPSPTPRSTCG